MRFSSRSFWRDPLQPNRFHRLLSFPRLILPIILHIFYASIYIMADFVRRLVSGGKARFKDSDLDLELDLAYITDHIIVMGYPAVGLEGFYRNRREDAKKFLDHRHGKNFWVFNFCPVRENSYDPAVFDGRVSRYPFPDHHAPPLAMLALAVREVRSWLNGSPERVAVFHCKAGKGRSGTLACAYLLSLEGPPAPPALERSYSKKEWAKLRRGLLPRTRTTTKGVEPTTKAKKQWARERAERLMDEMPHDDAIVLPEMEPDADADEESNATVVPETPSEGEVSKGKEKPSPDASIPSESHVETPSSDSGQRRATGVTRHRKAKGKSNSQAEATLASILELHTARRMRRNSSPESSESSFDTSSNASSSSNSEDISKTPKQGISIPSQRRWLRYWSILLAGAGPPGFWADPPAPRRVRLHEMTVRMYETKGLKLGVVKAASHILERALPFVTGDPRPDAYGHGELWVSLARYDDPLVEVLEKWERWSRAEGPGGMGRRREGGDIMPAEGKEGEEEHIGDIFKDGRWDTNKMVRSFARLGVVSGEDEKDGKIVTRKLRVKDGDDGVVLDANREVRIKLYMGQVFMAWMWLIPAFSLPPPPSDPDETPEPVTLKFTRAELDFPIGLGASLIDFELSVQELSSNAPGQPPSRAPTGESAVESGGKSAGVVHALGAGSTLREGVEAGQALED